MREDIKELEKFAEEATRPKIKDILGIELRKLQTELITKEEKLKKLQESAQATPVSQSSSSTSTGSTGYTKEITTYGKICI